MIKRCGIAMQVLITLKNKLYRLCFWIRCPIITVAIEVTRNGLSLNHTVNINIGMQVHPANESQIGRNARPRFHLPVTISILKKADTDEFCS
uniref:SJCHGC09721 protein n=1 Tax=Schistosoma japonicum TaxID=6182 RepID=Q5BR20_SCHJA|nr:SJCHGC09721 protein [Schistosoma japonicum]